MATELYQYTPLSSESSFRLLRLVRPPLAGALRTPIEIDLFEAPIEDSPPFEAVSYAWDHADTYCTLLCNGCRLKVSPVIVEMIEHLHHISNIGTFWVDAVCIDQSSTFDKNIQVPRMRDVFSKAHRVWVWLGKGSHESKVAFEFLMEVETLWPHDVAASNGKRAKQWHICLKKYQGTIKQQIQSSTTELILADIVRNRRGVYDAVDTDFIGDIINLPWFHRTWTIQEVALAKSAIIVCGPVNLPWSSLLEALKRLQDSQIHKQTLISIQPERRAFSNPATFFDDIRTHVLMTDVVHHRKSLPLSRAFDLIRRNNSSDPRDKIYGLYGILDYLEIQDLPPVNYTETVQHLYYQITCAIMRNDQRLHILYLIGLTPTLPDLPTWVPDYSNTEFIRFIDVHGNEASGRLSGSFCYPVTDLTLSVNGILLDEVDITASSTSICTPDFRQGWAARKHLSSPEERHNAVTELIRTLQSWINVSRSVNFYPTGEAPRTAFYKIMTQPTHAGSQNWTMPVVTRASRDAFNRWIFLLDTHLPDHETHRQSWIRSIQANADSAAIVKDYIRLFGCSQDPQEWSLELQIRLILRAIDLELSTLQHDVSLLSYHRTFFATKNGYMGVGPRQARPTDRVALISGLQLPFIVRRAGDNYKLIGPAYIHGLMKGERWDKGLVESITLV